MIKTDLRAIQQKIHAAASRATSIAGNFSLSDIVLVGVTKFADVPAINGAIQAGLFHIAENRVQLAEAKFPQLAELSAGRPVIKHLIGHLQTNKAKDAVRLFDLIQSVDSLKLAAEIDKRAAAAAKVQDILIQVDIAREEQKFGCPQEELPVLMEGLKTLSHVRLQGLMTMAPFLTAADEAAVRSVFRRCRTVFDSLAKGPLPPGGQMKYLSMGMSGDFEIALEEGANMVRIGSALFKSGAQQELK